ncbi:unnamed protein product [Calicophoron daubneyi]|uniref:PEHE domain-containing protein n=1 Tax=Calicophoron daubneyi TaxID=300641 RepID=A0AAV2SWR1_CALDB
MVTAVEPNIGGVLRRFHLHSVDAAISEFSPRTPLTDLTKFRLHPFLFKRQPKSQEHCCAPHHRRVPPMHTDPKAARRLSRLHHRHSHQSVPHKKKLGSAEKPTFLPPVLRSSDHPSPPVLLPLSPAPERQTPVSGRSSWYACPPTLSNPKSPVPGSSPSYGQECRYAAVDPILMTAASFLGIRTPFSKVESSSLPLSLPNGVNTRKRTSSTNSHCENVSDTSESTASMPYVAGCNGNHSTEHLPTPNHVGPELCTNTVSYVAHGNSPILNEAKPVNRTKRKVDSSRILSSGAPREGEPGALSPTMSPKPMKRRRSFDLLTEPSIHGSPDPDAESKPRERHPTQFLQIESFSSPAPTHEGPMYLYTDTEYYLPDYSMQSSDFFHDDTLPDSEEEGLPELRSDPNPAQCVIEVPSWRIPSLTDFTVAGENVQATTRKTSSKETTTQSEKDDSPGIRVLRAGVIRSPGVLELHRDLSSDCQRQQKLVNPCSRGKSSNLTPSGSEDTSDAAYTSRHGRLEAEEIRRERLSRQRTMELELKQRLEQRDRATWHKRQPGRLHMLERYNPEVRMPQYLNYAFNQVSHLHTCDSIPVIAFGCRVPLSGLRSFTRSSA